MYTQAELKQHVAQAAVEYILPYLKPDSILGVGTGSTVDLFIRALAPYAERFKGAVSSSERSSALLHSLGVPVHDLNAVEAMGWYVDGADEIDHHLNMTKGGGGALTREKIVASVAEHFLCIADESKLVQQLGAFPLPVEVIPMACNAVARQLRQLGAEPRLRPGFVTDNGGLILDVGGLTITDPAQLEAQINNIAGVVCCGLFALKPASQVLLAGQDGVKSLSLHNS